MRQILKSILLLLFFSLPLSVYCSVNTKKYTYLEEFMLWTGEYPDKNEYPTNRIPGQTYDCYIEKGVGLKFQTTTPPEIESYELWTTTGNCIYADKNEDSFVEFLFTLSGTYEIHLITPDSILVGKINI